jgi:hypothetical protein
MLSLRTTILLALAAAAPSVLSHTWGEQLRNINDQGQYVGAYGYMRGYRVRGGPDYNEDALVQRMPASNGEGKTFITADQLLCHENQREQKQASDKFPRLQTTPGSFVAIKYQENGHITTADTIKGKPEKGGSVYVYGTTDPKSDEKLVDVLQWTHDGKGGDKRGVLLAINDYDDGRCYLNNETPIATERKKANPAYMAGTPQSGPVNSVMYCETDVKLPDTIEQGKPYTLYWVWQWPTLPSTEGLPNGKDEYYSTCIDVDVTSANVAMAAEDESQLKKFAMLQQDAVSTAVSDWASRTALFTDLPSKREMGPVFSGLPNGGSGADTPAPTGGAPAPPVTSAAHPSASTAPPAASSASPVLSVTPSATSAVASSSIVAIPVPSGSAAISSSVEIQVPTLSGRPGAAPTSSTGASSSFAAAPASTSISTLPGRPGAAPTSSFNDDDVVTVTETTMMTVTAPAVTPTQPAASAITPRAAHRILHRNGAKFRGMFTA